MDEDIGEALHFLQTAVLRASHIIDALLRLSRVGRVEYRQQKVEVRDIVPRVVDAMQGSIRARRAHVIVDELPPVWGDPTALEQVFANLIGNAVNYLDPAREGRIEIGTTPAPPGVHSLRIFYVRDNGLGIPAVALAAAFQRVSAAARQCGGGRGHRPCARAPRGGAARRARVGGVERGRGHDVLSVAARSRGADRAAGCRNACRRWWTVFTRFVMGAKCARAPVIVTSQRQSGGAAAHAANAAPWHKYALNSRRGLSSLLPRIDQ